MHIKQRRYSGKLAIVSALVVMLLGHVLLKTRYEVGTHSLVFSGWYWFCMALGGFLLSVYRPGKSLSEVQELSTSAVGLAVYCVITSLAYLIEARRSVDSVDLFYFLCESRDMLWGEHPQNHLATFHFPGVYRFWGLILSLYGESYEAVQWAAVTLLAVNAALISIIVARMTSQIPVALLSGVLYLVVSLRYEGLTGSRELICTIPYLTGIWIWVEQGEIRRRINLAAFALGLGLGLALYFKQQAGLLSLGAVWLLERRESETGKSRIGQAASFLIAAVAAALIFLVLILAEGSGLTPLFRGLQWASEYKHEGSWTANMLIQIRNDESFALITFFALTGSLGSLFRISIFERKYRNLCLQIATAAAVTMIQYRVRGYLHYTLLAMPGIIIVFSIQFAAVWRSLSGGKLLQIQCQVALVMLLLVPMLYNGQRSIKLDVTEWDRKQRNSSLPKAWHEEPETLSEINELKSLIPSRSEMEILPSGRNVIYFLLSGVNSGGYAFKEMTPETDFDHNPPEYVAVFRPNTPWDEESWKTSEAGRRLEKFILSGYKKQDTKTGVDVYRRELSSDQAQ